MLALFSNPPDQEALRLDKEDKILSQISRKYSENVSLERLHASDIDSIYSLISDTSFRILHFSGHGSPLGIYLDKTDLNSKDGELVSPERLVSLIELADQPPLLVVMLTCYSNDLLDELVDVAPFVITCRLGVPDECCLQFVKAFYDNLFMGRSIMSSFSNTIKLISIRGYKSDFFRLSRRSLIRKGSSKMVECKLGSNHNSILVNIDSVSHDLELLNLTEEEFVHLLSRKLKIHYWIFSIPREGALIPIGQLLFGEFNWENSQDVVYCTNLFKLQTNIKPLHLELWARLLTTYNDLISSDYRGIFNRDYLLNPSILRKSCERFKYLFKRYIIPSRISIEKLGFNQVIPNLEFAIVACDKANDYLLMDNNPQVIKELEICLTNLHEIVDAIKPPSENTKEMSKENSI